MNLPSLPIDKKLVEALTNARNVEEVRIANGLTRGTLAKVLSGKASGTRLIRGKR